MLKNIKEKQNTINILFEKTQNIIKKNDDYVLNNKYIPMEYVEVILNDYDTCIKEFKSIHILIPFIYKNYKKLQKNIELFKKCVFSKASYVNNIRKYNEKIIESDIINVETIIGKVENKSLDKQQLTCLAKKSNSHLVLAGAGTGKTLTMLAYVKYLLLSEKAKSDEILVLSFTNDSASEIDKRIKDETKEKIDAQTFHKLGINIMAHADGKKPSLTNLQENFMQYIQQIIKTKIQNDAKYFFLTQKYTYSIYGKCESEFSFDTIEEYEEYIEESPPTSLKGERLKSYSEVDVANFLYLNGIEYEYEAKYKFDTATIEYSQYKPDFYLPQYDIYIEMFGTNENGEVPTWFSAEEGLTPTETYQKGIKWKREIHALNNTTLIECFSYERLNGTLEKLLEQKLLKYGVKFNPIKNEYVIKQLNDIYRIDAINYLSKEVEQIINLLKGQNISIEELKNRNKNITNQPKARYIKYINDLIIQIVEPIYETYQTDLKNRKEIDFNDMINIATQYIKENKFIHKYKFVIIDEYQDMSFIRYNLIKAMKDQKDFNMICVGDDWQSIYQFTGSDIGYIIDFEEYWGLSDISKIETTYRFQRSVIEKAHNFVTKNPKQIDKHIVSKNQENSATVRGAEYRNIEEEIELIKKELNRIPENSSVFLLGRYKRDIDFLKTDNDFIFNKSESKCIIKYKKKQLHIEFMSIHQSKGLEADYVIVLNNNDDAYGFPSKIKNPPIYSLLLKNSDTYPYAEERRLLYVAITRTKQDVLLLCDKNRKSSFFKELSIDYDEEFCGYKTCKRCGARMIVREGKHGLFYGCTNYYKNNCRYTEKYSQ